MNPSLLQKLKIDYDFKFSEYEGEYSKQRIFTYLNALSEAIKGFPSWAYDDIYLKTHNSGGHIYHQINGSNKGLEGGSLFGFIKISCKPFAAWQFLMFLMKQDFST
ncbi:MAG: hypothetical protein DRO88_07135 [Promethearchaeia archaeon]|nr:MAG: hypothetical protein DRO88_07135 [Candidatus Lokiarchaeia archaeon]